MITNELRIGITINWQNRPITIKNKTELFNIIDDNGVNSKPIPLTEEWLLKFGFEKEIKKSRTLFYKHITNLKICLFESDIEDYYIALRIDDLEDVDMFETIRFKHVHSLQNLCFSLTNEELCIK